jgi:hypothetical protein
MPNENYRRCSLGFKEPRETDRDRRVDDDNLDAAAAPTLASLCI